MVTVLWIEDEIYNIQALKKMFNIRGINLIKARSESEAFEKLRLKFDLILLDIILPQNTDDSLEISQEFLKYTEDSPKDSSEQLIDFVGLSILKKLYKENCKVPIFVYTIVNDLNVKKEIENNGGRYYYKGSTRLAVLCDDIIKAAG